MSLPNELLPVGLLGAGAAGGYEIERSLRFNSSDSAHCTRTAGTPTNSGTWTFSTWIKRSGLNIDTSILGGRASGTATQIYFKSNNTIRWFEGSTADFSTTAVFRDPSSWYHFVFVKNGSTSCTIYVNGVQLQQNTTSIPSTSSFNTNGGELYLGVIPLLPSSITYYASHYYSEVHFIDGQALDPTSFGEFDENGIWQPIAYEGTYGQNGSHLPFSDNSTASALGTDTSGNGNDWTVNNISVTAGAGNDSLVDTPTNYGTDTGAGGEVRGNYSTLNPINPLTCTLANGNLECTTPVAGSTFGSSTFNIPKSGKWYWEFTTTTNGDYSFSGVRNIIDITQYVVYWAATGEKYVNGVASAYGASCTTGDIIGVAVDSDAGTLTFYKNNVSQGAISVSFASGNYAAVFQDGTSSLGVNFTVNFGQRPFVYQAPTDHKCLCSTNLPTPTIENGSDYMTAVTYSGNGSTQTIETGFSPDLVWVKGRNEAFYHRLTTSLQTQPNYLASNATDAEASGNGVISALTSTGFTVDINGGTGGTNTTGINYVGWAWDAGSSTVENTDGSITSQVRANPSAGFSIATYTGTKTSAGNDTIGHGLNAQPALVISKDRGNVTPWIVQHISLGSDEYLTLNTTSAVSNSVSIGAGNLPKPTSSVFYGSWLSGLNTNGANFVAYCFAPVEGYSAFGTYTGNGNTSGDGPFVFCGLRPRWVMVKCSTDGSSASDWFIFDSERNAYNLVNSQLYPNRNIAESTSNTHAFDFVSNGFKVRSTSTSTLSNGSGQTYIYAAFAENPFSLARAR
jgi:hypothetical protein